VHFRFAATTHHLLSVLRPHPHRAVPTERIACGFVVGDGVLAQEIFQTAVQRRPVAVLRARSTAHQGMRKLLGRSASHRTVTTHYRAASRREVLCRRKVQQLHTNNRTQAPLESTTCCRNSHWSGCADMDYNMPSQNDDRKWFGWMHHVLAATIVSDTASKFYSIAGIKSPNSNSCNGHYIWRLFLKQREIIFLFYCIIPLRCSWAKHLRNCVAILSSKRTCFPFVPIAKM